MPRRVPNWPAERDVDFGLDVSNRNIGRRSRCRWPALITSNVILRTERNLDPSDELYSALSDRADSEGQTVAPLDCASG